MTNWFRTDVLKAMIAEITVDDAALRLSPSALAEVRVFCEDSAASVTLVLAADGDAFANPRWVEHYAPLFDHPAIAIRARSALGRPLEDRELLALTKLVRLEIELPSASPATLAALAGTALRDVVTNIVRLRLSAMEVGRRPELRFSTAVFPTNLTHLGGVARLAHVLGVAAMTIEEGSRPGVPASTDDALTGITEDQVKRLAQSTIDAAGALQSAGATLNIDRRLGAKLEPAVRAVYAAGACSALPFAEQTRPATGPCLQPWTRAVVRADGAVRLCSGELPAVGNVNDASLDAIVNGERSRGLRASLLEEARPPACARCRHATAFGPGAFTATVENAHKQFDAAILPWRYERGRGLRYDAENGIRTEARILLDEYDRAIGPALAHAGNYVVIPVRDLDRMIDATETEPSQTSFVDLGCGMGRAILHAGRRPFRRVVGVELADDLYRIARENLASYRGPRHAATIEVVHGNALDYPFPDGNLIVFFFNSFKPPVLEPVLDRLAGHPSDVWFLYYTHVHEATLDANPAFVPVVDLGFGRIWKKPARIGAPA